MLSGVKGYIFDYGGTLDTGGMHWGKALWHAYVRQRVPVDEQTFREAYVHVERILGRNRIIMPHFTFRRTLYVKLRMEMELIAGRLPGFVVDDWHWAVFDDIYERTCRFTADSRRVLGVLRERCAGRMALVSNFYGNVETVLGEMGLAGMFDKVIESAVVGIRKPDPRIFVLGAEALGLTPGECVVTGDSYDKDIEAAKRAGCATVWIKGEGWTDEQPDGKAADMVISSVDELLTIL